MIDDERVDPLIRDERDVGLGLSPLDDLGVEGENLRLHGVAAGVAFRAAVAQAVVFPGDHETVGQ